MRFQRSLLLVFLCIAVIAIALLFILFIPGQQAATRFIPGQQAAGNTFVTRVGSSLYNNGKPFRFAGANMPWLGMISAHRYPTTAEIDAGFQEANAMHATALRSENMGESVGCPLCIEPSLNKFNDIAFNSIDYAIKTAASYHIRVFIPFVDNTYGYPHGDFGTFTRWRGLTDPQQFFTDPTVIQDFENYIAHILNHVNQYTGIAMKDDPTIMFWETGDELYTAPDSWTEMIARYIKSIDPHHLVADGKAGNVGRNLSSSQLQLPDVDLYTSHLYPHKAWQNFAYLTQQMQTSANLAKQYNKVYYVGEFDWTSRSGTPAELQSFLSAIENNNVAGEAYWELVPPGHQVGKYTLHYPGDNPDMQQRVQMLTRHAINMSSSIS